ncbi:MAG TPA: hypothetical protein VMC09_16255 [Anaerolineales bacterium]|nr:hypothetical protein [Anaerolineales bacterium]
MKKPFSRIVKELFLGQIVGIGAIVAILIAFPASIYLTFSFVPIFFLFLAAWLPGRWAVSLGELSYGIGCLLSLLLTALAATLVQRWLGGRMDKFN